MTFHFSSLIPDRFRGGKSPAVSAGTKAVVREGGALGPYEAAFADFRFREVNPFLFEAIREALPVVNGAINMLGMLDGIVRVEAESDRLQGVLDAFMAEVPVQDLQYGYQSFYNLLNNEKYEQGHAVGEWILADKGKGVGRLKVADSKGTYFRRADDGLLETWYRPPAQQRGRRDGTDNVERVLRNSYQSHSLLNFLPDSGYRQIDTSALMYIGYNNEADNPYGTSIMRSMEFDARVLLVMKNAVHNTWQRFGDPSFVATLKKKRKGGDVNPTLIENDRKAVSQSIADAMDAKRSGNSADVVSAIGPDDELTITVLGADGQVLEVEMPARFILEGLVANTGLPPWFLSLIWGTSERLAQRQGELVLQGSRTRFEVLLPVLRKPIDAHLRGLGMAFKRGDYRLVQDLPSLQDIEAMARANMMNASADAIREGRDLNVGQDGSDPNVPKVYKFARAVPTEKAIHAHKAETYVEDEAALLRLERRAERALEQAWQDLYEGVIDVLGAGGKAAEAPRAKVPETPVFAYDPAIMLYELRRVMDAFLRSVAVEDAELAQSMVAAWLRGVENASAEIGTTADMSAATRAAVSRELAARGFEQVRETLTRAYRNDILLAIEEGSYNGMGMNEVARALKQRFDDLNSNWSRLARSEIAAAQGRGKLDLFAENGIEEYDWKRAGGACPICVGLAENGPYRVGEGPSPMTDSHPNCRCTVSARVPVAA